MFTEEVVMYRGGNDEFNIPIHTLILPDPRILGLCLPAEEGNLLVWCYDKANKVRKRIRNRLEDQQHWRDFQFDIPDLWPVAKKFQRCDGDIVMALWGAYHGLVQHFMPDVKGETYGMKDVVHGIRYTGRAWYTKRRKV